MWLKSKKEVVENVRITPGDYVLGLEEAENKQPVAREVKEAIEQIRYFEKRQNDIRFLSYRQFSMDDSLTRTNQVVDGMAKRFYDTVDQMITCIGMQEETDKCETMQKLIRTNDTIIEDLKSLLTFLLEILEHGKTRSLSEIEDVVNTMEEEYINELTKK